MTSTQITPETAPRDLAGLKNQGRFNLRILAQQLGALEQEASKTAFMQQSSDDQAATVLRLLQERDGTAGKAAGKGGGGASPRQPSTKGAAGKTSAPAGGKVQGEAAQGSGGGAANGAGGGTAVGAGAEKLLSAIKGLSDKIDGFQGDIVNLQTQVSQLQGISAGTNRFVALSIGLAGKLAEQTLGASLEQILDIVLEDMPAVEAAMKRMDQDGAGEGEGESDEGNEE